LAIASGATPIGSAGRAPDKKAVLRKKLTERRRRRRSNIGAIIYLSSTTNFDFIVDKIKIDYSHRELFMRF
jgi:hypothetical protein